VIDPLDGTSSFARALPVWGIGIGLLHRGEPRAGYLRFPFINQTFLFENGVGLFNDRPLPPAKHHPVSRDTRNIMVTSIHAYLDVRRIARFRIHNLGSNLYHMLALAMGRCEAIISGPCYLWDLAPALPFTRARGYVERFADGSVLCLSDMVNAPDFGFAVKQPLLAGPPDEVQSLMAMLTQSRSHQQV
jgi:fructose-1,6-bisphosphatase/inositol monophosphatase family enzyme